MPSRLRLAQLGPNSYFSRCPYFDVPDRFSVNGASGEDDAGIGLLGTLKISFKLSIGQRVLEKGRTPLNEIGLGRQPRDQAREVLATKGMERNASF